jgi:hypothetical protein
MKWFDVDKEGLAKIVSRRPKYFILFELLQNSWDENSKTVSLIIEKQKNSKLAKIIIEDDNPTGFENLKHSFTLFAESAKKSDPSKRGRFNLGEKLVLSLCNEATIISTKGGIEFSSTGRKTLRRKRDVGSIFIATIKMTNKEVEDAIEAVGKLIPPYGIKTTINGKELAHKTPITSYNTQLPTEIADSEGFLKRSVRYTEVQIYSSNNDGWIYEMGIPVVETGDKYNVNIMQKVPLNIERDNVTPRYLKQVRTSVLDNTIDLLEKDETVENWVSEALTDKNILSSTVKTLIEKRFGDKVVSYDPSDAEANKLAVSKGYTVIHGRHLNKEQWNNVRGADAILPAGQVTPSPKPFSDDPNADSLNVIDKQYWRECEKVVFEKLGKLSYLLINKKIKFTLADDIEWNYNACFSKHSVEMTFNRAAIGKSWFENDLSDDVLRLFIHELGHYYSSDHLSSEYHDALCKIGAKLTLIAISNKNLF